MLYRAPFLLLAFLFVVICPAEAVYGQVVEVDNGATVQVQNGAVLNLEDGQMDLGDPGATALLSEMGASRVTGGTLTATRMLNGHSDADPGGLGAVVSASADLGAVTVTRGHAIQTAGGNVSIARYYDIAPEKNNNGLSADLTFTYHDDELNGLMESNLVLFKSPDGGTSWAERGSDSRATSPTGGNTVTLNDVSSFSRWTLGSEANPLPVELTSFDGSQWKAGIRLTWQTASEKNNAGFRILRRGEGAKGREGTWTEVGFVDGAGTTTEAKTYRFTDSDLPYAADSVAYRLKQVDIDGSVSFSDPISVARDGVESLQLRAPYPNPARQRATVRFAVPDHATSSGMAMGLYDVLGRQVRVVEVEAEPGRHERVLNVGDVSSGTYVLRLRIGDTVKTRKLTVVR
jgi:hypothetical protein